MRHNMQADRARTDALTNGDDIFRVSTKGGNIVTNPYICLQGYTDMSHIDPSSYIGRLHVDLGAQHLYFVQLLGPYW